MVPVVAVGSIAGGVLAVTESPAHAATVTVGYSCAYYSNVSLFGGAYGSMGCGTQTSPYANANSAAPSVTLPANGAYTAASDGNGAAAIYGPAYIVSSPYDTNDNLTNTGALSVFTYATATQTFGQAQAKSLGPSPFWTANPSSWVPPGRSAVTTEGYAKATCTSTSTTNNAAVEIKNGYVDTALDANGYPTNTVVIPNNPSQGYTVNFTIDNVGDHGYIVFNERVTNADGSLTVNAAHMYMQGPIALGEVIYGQVKCGHV